MKTTTHIEQAVEEWKRLYDGTDHNPTWHHIETWLRQTLATIDAKAREPYNELIMAVANKYKGETRHETALRYINQSESGSMEAAKQPAQEQ